ncbi:MAG: hypothetical protein CMH89_00320 [Oceanicaulis sp.]|nr:hypothetical protein [Oceanicaulis sp.]|tara:strand:+ start:98 stop:298 length:201 start_codon:yes stop_codon:yes gene_type:complete
MRAASLLALFWNPETLTMRCKKPVRSVELKLSQRAVFNGLVNSKEGADRYQTGSTSDDRYGELCEQ